MERNYDVGNRELLALVLALQEWRHWLEGSAEPSVVWTEHKNLREATQLPAGPLGSLPGLLCLCLHPRSKNTKLVALIRQFSTDQLDHNPSVILQPSCIMGAATWQVEEHIHKVLRSAPTAGRAPLNTLFVPEARSSEVLQCGHF